jgi:hypothetical protein
MDSKWDVQFSFDVGDMELHHVSFSWHQANGEATIIVDGMEVLNETHLFGLKHKSLYCISVGTAERHDVVIEKKTRAMYGGIRKQSFRAFVDGDVIAEH